MARLEPMIEAREMDIIYNQGASNEFHAIKKVDLEIYPGEFVALFGASGSGKSTLLYNFLGVLPYQAGTLKVAGTDPYDLAPMDKVHFLRETIGIIYQAFYLVPSLTVMDNVALPLIFAGVTKQERERRAMRVLERFGVGHIAEKFPTMVSGGQLQRASVARAVTTNPHILLADEPTGNLDSVSAHQVLDTLEELNREGQTIVMITHNASQLRLAHRTYYLKDGVVEREVMNPEKKQIKKVRNNKAVVTEVERLAQIYPYLEAVDLKVKSITNYLLDELSLDQIARVEKAVKLIVEGKISSDEFERQLAIPMQNNGAGIHATVAKSMAKRAGELLKDARDITRFRRSIGQLEETDPDQRKFIRRLRDSMLEQYRGKPKPEQIKSLEHAIADRISGAYSPTAFEAIMSTPHAEDGVGFSVTSARNMARHLEKLLAQGVEKD